MPPNRTFAIFDFGASRLQGLQSQGWLVALSLLVVIQGVLLWFGCAYSSPTIDEPAHLVAGVEYWQSGRTTLYSVNPPMFKLVSTLPGVIRGSIELPRNIASENVLLSKRPEFDLGWMFAKQDRVGFVAQLVEARRICSIFCLFGTVGVYFFARQWLSSSRSLLAAAMWAFLPVTLGYGALLTADIPAASVGCWASIAVYHSLQGPGRRRDIMRRDTVAAVWIGFAILTKFTWLIAIPIYTLAIVFCELKHLLVRDENGLEANNKLRLAFSIGGKTSLRLIWVVFFVWGTTCTGYRWSGMFQPIGAFQFQSSLLSTLFHGLPENGWMNNLPVMIPSDMVIGLDLQWRDFDHPRMNYLNGEWKRGGWWYYYVVAIAIKLPIALHILSIFALANWTHRRQLLCYCLVPSTVVFLLVSSKTNMCEHTRYLWIILPYLCVIASSVPSKKPWTKALVLILASWSMLSGIMTFPCGISYGNELVGSPRDTWRVLSGSNLDWYTDWYGVKRWLARNPPNLPTAIYSDRQFVLDVALDTSDTPPRSVQSLLEHGEDFDVLLIVTTDSRLILQRDTRLISLFEQRNCNKILCCTEVYQMKWFQIRDLQGLQWYRRD
jgi:hypothetical protein